MEQVFSFLKQRGYSNVESGYYAYIENWINEWRGKAEWLKIEEYNRSGTYDLYSLGMAKKICEDFSSIITSEPFNIKAKKNDEELKKLLKESKVMEKLSDNLEYLACTGSIASVARIKNATLKEKNGTLTIAKNKKTKIKTIDLKANQIIPLTIEDGEIINFAFVSKEKRKIGSELKTVYYLELHELIDKGYQITNKYIIKDSNEEYKPKGIIETYNTLSDIPLFSFTKMPYVNNIENNNNLGISILGNAQDQLLMCDLVYNNFGMDFKLGQKLLIINKKLTRMVQEPYTDKDGNIRTRTKVEYPSDLRKQQFMQVDEGIMADGKENVYVHEYNPDLRVGDNKEGIQFALDNLSFKCGYGTDYYSFTNGKVVAKTATEAVLSNKDLVSNARKSRAAVNEYLIGICRALLLCEKMLGDSKIDENQDIEIKDVDTFLEDDESKREKAKEEVQLGLKSKKKFLMEQNGYTEEEAEKELQQIAKEDDIGNIDLGE